MVLLVVCGLAGLKAGFGSIQGSHMLSQSLIEELSPQ